MPLTRSFRETVAKRVREDVAFRAALVEEIGQAFLEGDQETGCVLLRHVINVLTRDVSGLPDGQIDTSDPDAPEVTDWTGAVRGKFCSPPPTKRVPAPGTRVRFHVPSPVERGQKRRR